MLSGFETVLIQCYGLRVAEVCLSYEFWVLFATAVASCLGFGFEYGGGLYGLWGFGFEF